MYLICEDSNTIDILRWYYKPSSNATADPIIPGDRDGRLATEGNTLIISNVNESDQGLYSCVHKDFGQIDEVRLDVTGKV